MREDCSCWYTGARGYLAGPSCGSPLVDTLGKRMALTVCKMAGATASGATRMCLQTTGSHVAVLVDSESRGGLQLLAVGKAVTSEVCDTAEECGAAARGNLLSVMRSKRVLAAGVVLSVLPLVDALLSVTWTLRGTCRMQKRQLSAQGGGAIAAGGAACYWTAGDADARWGPGRGHWAS